MIWYLFLDDERYPPLDGAFNWRIARNVDDAMYYIQTYGMPAHMSIDHDLGAGEQTGMDFVKTLVSYCDDVGICRNHAGPLRPFDGSDVRRICDRIWIAGSGRRRSRLTME